MAEGAPNVPPNGGANDGGDGVDMSPEGMTDALVGAAKEVAKVGIQMSIAGYEAQAASKHP